MNFQLRNSHSSPLFKKSFILKFSDKVNLENTLLSVNPSIIFYPRFSMTDFYFHLTNTTMKPLGITMAIFISPLTKLTFMARILSLFKWN